MQKKALAVAIGAALMIPAAAYAQKGGGKGEGAEPDSVVVLYGKVYPELVFPDSKAGSATSGTFATNSPDYCTICTRPAGENAVIKRTEMESSNSRFGIRGHERLGGDLKAIFQLETQFLLDSNNTGFAQRDSFVGLAHKRWGTVKLGRFDTPFKEYGDDISFLGVSSGNFTSTSNLYRHIGFGGQNNAARFHERRVNAVQYESPDLGPVDFKVQWSTNEAPVQLAALPGQVIRDPRAFSAGLKLELGPAELMFGHEIHYDLFGLSSNLPSALRNNAIPTAANGTYARSKDTASAVAVKFKFGNHQFEVDHNWKRYRENGFVAAGRPNEYKNTAWMVLWESRWNDQWRTAAHYIKANAGSCKLSAPSATLTGCNTNGLEGEQYALGFAYHFSRRTYLFVMATLVKNGFAAEYNNSNLQDINPGEDIRQIGVGLHTSW